jgi:hypothetical protein
MTDPAPDERKQPAKPAPADMEDPEGPHPFGMFPVIVLLVLILVGLIVAFKLRDVSNLQDCVMSGRKNCAPVDTTDLK